MNWGTIINNVITFAGGAIAAYLAFKGKTITAKSSNESVYAGSVKDLLQRANEQLDEIAEKDNKIAELTAQVKALTDQVKQQNRTIDALTKQVGEINNKQRMKQR